MDQLLIYSDFPILSVLIFLPLAGIVPLLLINNDSFSRYWAVIVTAVVAVMSISLITGFDTTTASFQFAEKHTWVQSLNINYVIGMDGISILLFLFFS